MQGWTATNYEAWSYKKKSFKIQIAISLFDFF